MIKARKLSAGLMGIVLSLSIFMQTVTVVRAEDQDNIESAVEISVTEESVINEPEIYNEQDKLLLAALIQCEAGGEPYEGQIAVGAVVMNRVKSSKYPNNIHDVIYNPHQFEPAANGKLERAYNSQNIYSSCIQAAEEALSGTSNIGECLSFHRYDGCNGTVIGNHVFK